MHNLQLVDTLDGGHFAFDRNNYPIDQGIYSELYACLFSTSTAEWSLDSAFETIAPKITSKTGLTLKNNGSTSLASINLIKKAIQDDLKRFTTKNPSIDVLGTEVAFWSKTILIIIELTGYTDAFNFIYQETKESLNNANFKTY